MHKLRSSPGRKNKKSNNIRGEEHNRITVNAERLDRYLNKYREKIILQCRDTVNNHVVETIKCRIYGVNSSHSQAGVRLYVDFFIAEKINIELES
jgi:hypothetical protein